MKHTWKLATVASLSLALLVGCGNAATTELDKNDTNKAQAKTDSNSGGSKDTAAKQDDKKNDKKDYWTYYNDAKWSDNFNGLKMEIQKVVVSDTIPKLASDKSDAKTSSAVGIKFKMENTTKGKFTAYPDQAKLVTSTGEQLDMPDIFMGDHIGGEIDEGVIKEGNIIWPLERGHAEDIKWVKFTWSAHPGAMDNFDAEGKDFEVKLELKK